MMSIVINLLHSGHVCLLTAMLKFIILLYIFNSLIWLTGLAEVVSTCPRQLKLILSIINKDNNDLYHFFYILSGCWYAIG